MAGITAAKAQKNLDDWTLASEAAAIKQSFTIAGRSLTYADAGHIMKMIDFWQAKVDEIARGGRTARIRLGVPVT